MYASRRFAPIIIDFIFGLIQIILVIKIFLELFGANSATPFVAWIYSICKTLQYPFQGIFPSPIFRNGFVLDMSALVALLVYTLIAYLVTELMRYSVLLTKKYNDHEHE